tara:strand:+ start:2352 stop:3038 length:687 start_codon:yes stop_codon:yes gene_type:complete
MAIFLDTGIIEDIQKYHEMGIIRGVTTNPTIISKEIREISHNKNEIKDYFNKLAKLIYPLPLSLEVTTNEKEEMIRQAKEFSSWSDNINVKITIHGPNGELENLEVIHKLENENNIKVNVTAMMSAQQCFIASLAGATYVSLFGGRINDMGYNSVDEIKKLRKLIDDFNLKSKIILGSTREALNVIEWLTAGAHIVTCSPKFLERIIVHPYTKETVKMFLNDGKKIKI